MTHPSEMSQSKYNRGHEMILEGRVEGVTFEIVTCVCVKYVKITCLVMYKDER